MVGCGRMSAKEGVFVPYRDAQACPIAFDEHTYWFLLSDPSSGFHSCPENIAHVLTLVRREFIGIFGAKVVDSHPTLIVLHHLDVPITFRAQNLIYLSSCDTFYLQHIYQFSHELCHFMVPSEVCAPYRWFEETLCEMMSWFILWRISRHPASAHIYEMGPLYGEPIQTYLFHCFEERYKTGNEPISAYVSANLPYLRAECYDRKMNAAVAYAMFPMFCKYPELWGIVPHLGELSADVSWDRALDFLCLAASVEEPRRDQLRQLLCQ